MDGARRIRKALMTLGARVAHRGGQVLQRNEWTWPEMKPMSDEARVGSERERGSPRPVAFSYGLWA